MAFDLPGALSAIRRLMAEPSPKITIAPAPNGRDALALRQQKDGEFVLEKLGGQSIEQPGHELLSIDSLLAYLRERIQPRGLAGSTVIGVTAGGVTVLLADHGIDLPGKVICSLRLAPAGRPWLTKSGSYMDPREAQRFLRSLPGTLTGRLPGQAQEVPLGDYLLSQLSALSLMKSSEMKMSLSSTGMVKMMAASEGRDITVQLPERMHLRLPYFHDLVDDTGDQVLFECEILVHTDDKNGVPVVAFEVVRLEDLRDAAVRAMAALLATELGEPWCVVAGKVGTIAVPHGPLLG